MHLEWMSMRWDIAISEWHSLKQYVRKGSNMVNYIQKQVSGNTVKCFPSAAVSINIIYSRHKGS